MKLYKFVFIGIIVTLAASCYVHQQVEIFKAGYTLQKTRTQLSYLIDQNRELVYNLSKLESPKHLLASMNSEEVEFRTSKDKRTNYQFAHLGSDNSSPRESFIGFILDLVTVNAEARSR